MYQGLLVNKLIVLKNRIMFSNAGFFLLTFLLVTLTIRWTAQHEYYLLQFNELFYDKHAKDDAQYAKIFMCGWNFAEKL